MTPRTNNASPTAITGRLKKARAFAEAARIVLEFQHEDVDLSSSYVTLVVHAGIAASDVLCMRKLKVYSRGESHTDAVNLLKQAEPGAAKHLDALLSLKTKAGYSIDGISTSDLKQAQRAINALLDLL